MSLSRNFTGATLAALVGVFGLQVTGFASTAAFAPQADASQVNPTSKIHVDPHPATPTPCVASPRSCGYPDANTTGVPAGVILKPASSITVTTPGAILNGLDVNGFVQVKANNVTIENSRITCGTGCSGRFTIEVRPGVTGLVIRDTEASGTTSVNAVVGGGGTLVLLRGNIHDGVDGVHVTSASVVRDSYIHDLAPSMTSHDDTIQQLSSSADHVVVVHNTLLPFSATTHVYNNSAYIGGTQSNMVFTDNLINGGSHTLQCPKIAVNNTFARNRFSNEYRYGTTDGNCRNLAGNHFDATNVMDGTNLPV